MTRCPQCGAESPDDAWNCVNCRINLYWAHEHYDELANIRTDQGLDEQASAPPFLVNAHSHELAERATRGLNGMSKVREIARRVMRGETGATGAASQED
ncbi:MAG TPA: hypothetical protein VF808_15945 [Ktedonobacterales bacterium]